MILTVMLLIISLIEQISYECMIQTNIYCFSNQRLINNLDSNPLPSWKPRTQTGRDYHLRAALFSSGDILNNVRRSCLTEIAVTLTKELTNN